jgi:hypothetical protein
VTITFSGADTVTQFDIPMVQPVPAITSMSPSSGPIAGGYTVTVNVFSVPSAELALAVRVGGKLVAPLQNRYALSFNITTRVLTFMMPALSDPGVVSIQVGSVMGSFQSYLGCTYYAAFCSSLSLVSNDVLLRSSPPFSEECDSRYCLSADVLPSAAVTASTPYGFTLGSVLELSVSGLYAFDTSHVLVTFAEGVVPMITSFKFVSLNTHSVALTLSVPAVASAMTLRGTVSSVRLNDPSYTLLAASKQSAFFYVFGLPSHCRRNNGFSIHRRCKCVY